MSFSSEEKQEIRQIVREEIRTEINHALTPLWELVPHLLTKEEAKHFATKDDIARLERKLDTHAGILNAHQKILWNEVMPQLEQHQTDISEIQSELGITSPQNSK